ncbi:MAG: hypothetical protein PUJ62_11015, partial [Lachnospiraceae bacterium]|nr:hypothetical protein [Lachnospiraceae bacterium]
SLMRTRSPRKVDDIPIAPSLYSLSNKMGNSLLAVRDINHKYIVVEGEYGLNTSERANALERDVKIHQDYHMEADRNSILFVKHRGYLRSPIMENYRQNSGGIF